ncbi:MAG: helix-hairpin-helix domain-containing protein [Candidatus Omnitrophica bacterium]|nr:helix-hairpin-helix domain-containing protein [Candidatus Omnitrophota bacterium]
MLDSSIQEKKVILVILGLLILAVLLAAVKRYYPQTADAVIYVQPQEISSNSRSLDKTPDNPLAIINLNTAASSELIQLTGIGQVIAGRIIDYRNARGGFKTKDDLLKVKGIGLKKLEKIKNQISLE